MIPVPASKYERELRFIDSEVARLNRGLKDLAERMPDSPSEAAKKADEVLGIQDKIATLIARKREIEDSFIRAGMDVPDIGRSMNATVHNAGGFEIHGTQEAETVAGLKPSQMSIQGINEDIRSINAELASIEDRRVAAEIEGDSDEVQKLDMMASSLRSRRDSLIQSAREIRSAPKEEEERPSQVSGEDLERIAKLESETASLRSQVSDVRNGLQDVKEQLRQIMLALGIEPDK